MHETNKQANKKGAKKKKIPDKNIVNLIKYTKSHLQLTAQSLVKITYRIILLGWWYKVQVTF